MLALALVSTGCGTAVSTSKREDSLQTSGGGSIVTQGAVARSDTATGVNTRNSEVSSGQTKQVALDRICTDVKSAGGGPVDSEGQVWRNDFGHSEKWRLVEALATEHGLAGQYLDGIRRRVVLVFHQDAKGIGQALARFNEALPGVSIAAYTACYSRQEIEQAEALLQARKWHPDALKGSALGFFWRPSDGRWAVSITTEHQEIVDTLRTALGEVAVVTWTKGKPLVRQPK